MSEFVDVVIPVYKDVPGSRRCIESVLRFSGSRLGKVVLIDDCGPDVSMKAMLKDHRDRYENIRLLENEHNRGFVSSVNRGLSICLRDVVILNSDAWVTANWLEQLWSAANSSEKIAAVSPLSNNGSLCSVPYFGGGIDASCFDGIDLQLEQLPIFTQMPTAVGFCMYMKRNVLDEIGLLDPAYGRGYQEENDWCQRARAAGYQVGRANRSFVFHEAAVSFGRHRESLDRIHNYRLLQRYPDYNQQNREFNASAEAHLAANWVQRRLSAVPFDSKPYHSV